MMHDNGASVTFTEDDVTSAYKAGFGAGILDERQRIVATIEDRMEYLRRFNPESIEANLLSHLRTKVMAGAG